MATIDIPDKICSHCGGTRWVISSEKAPTKNNPEKRRIKYRCRIKQSAATSKIKRRKYASFSEDKKKQIQKRNYELYGKKKLEIKKEERRIYLLNNPVIEKPKKSEEEKIIESRLRIKQWYHLNKNRPDVVEKRKKKDKLNDEKKRQTLANVYLRKQLKHHFKLSPELITEDSINKYKTYLLTLRQLKQLENEKESN